MKKALSLKINCLLTMILFPLLFYSMELIGQPSVTSVSPVSGSVLGGQTVTINGSGFTGATQVNFGALTLSSSSFTVNGGGTIITANIPSSNPPTTPPTSIPIVVDVTVTTPSGTSATSQFDRYAFINGDWQAYIPNFGSANVFTSEVNTKLVNPAPIAVGNGPNDAAINFDGSTAYCINSLDSTISVIDIRTMTVTNTFATSSNFPILISLSYNTSLGVYIGYTADYSSNTVTQINLSNGAILNTFNVGSNPTSGILNSAIDPTMFYVVNTGSSNITMINLTTLQSTTIDTGSGSIPSFISLAPDKSTAYFIDDNPNAYSFRQLLNVNTANPILGYTLTDPSFNFGGYQLFPQIAISSPQATSDVYAYVTNTGTNTVTAIDISQSPPVVPCPNPITVEYGPNGAAITPDGSTLYVCNATNNAITIVSDLPTLSPACSSPPTVDLLVGTTPTDPSITPDQAPLAHFTFAPNPAGVGQSITFDGSQSASPVGSIVSYAWDFGDSTTATGEAVTHSYSLAGNYTITLTVTNSAGTSTATSSYYNGQTLLKNGGPTAQYSLPILVEASLSISTTTTVTTSPNPSNLGQSVTFTAHVNAEDGTTPTGTLQFTVDGLNYGSPIPLVNGQATTTDSFFTAGTYHVGALYTPTPLSQYSSSIATPVNQIVNQDTTSTTLTISPPTQSTYGQAVTFTATVTASNPSGSGNPTGVVQFIYTNSPDVIFGTATLSTTGGITTATFTTSTLNANTYEIYASYQGDSNHQASNSVTQPYLVNPQPTTTVITSSHNPSAYGQAVTFDVTVSPTIPGSGPPLGEVNFTNNGISIGTAILSPSGDNSVAFFTTAPPLLVGTHTIMATYLDIVDNNFSTSNDMVNQQVNQDSTTTTIISSSANPSLYGQSISFTAHVVNTSSGSSAIPTGIVSFTADGNDIGSGTLDVNGNATSPPISNLTGGNHTIIATYEGNTNLSGSTSPEIIQIVNQDPTTTTIIASPSSPSIVGQTVTFTATVTPTNPGTPTGTVQFIVDGQPYAAPIPLNGNAMASLSTATLAVGPHTIEAIYSGDNQHTTSISPSINYTVIQDPITTTTTTTTIMSSMNPALFGQPVTFTATVTANSPGLGTPTGTVIFDIDGVLGSPISLVNGQASFSTSSLSPGNHTIIAIYSGDPTHLASTSTPYIETIISILPPRNLHVVQVTNRFATQTDVVNVITWKAPLTGTVPVFYQIYRDPQLTILVANVKSDEYSSSSSSSSHKSFRYDDHNRKKRHSYRYFIVSIDPFGNVSVPTEVVFHGERNSNF
jgi:hypothetical protein